MADGESDSGENGGGGRRRRRRFWLGGSHRTEAENRRLWGKEQVVGKATGKQGKGGTELGGLCQQNRQKSCISDSGGIARKGRNDTWLQGLHAGTSETGPVKTKELMLLVAVSMLVVAVVKADSASKMQ